jgi:hypothetical protein
MITISIEIHFTTLYTADFGTRADPSPNGSARVPRFAMKNVVKMYLNTNRNHSQLKPLRRRDPDYQIRNTFSFDIA